MDDEEYEVADKIQQLNDLELACVTCFVADQHCCIINCDKDGLAALEAEVVKTCEETFGLRSAIVRCDKTTTNDIFSQAILLNDEKAKSLEGDDYISKRDKQPQDKSKASPRPDMSEGRIADVIVTTGLNLAPEHVQIQALELIRSQRTFSRKEVHVAPARFLVISLQQRDGKRLHALLNDQVFLSHEHEPDEYGNDDASEVDSMASVIRSPPATPGDMNKKRFSNGGIFITYKEIKHLQTLTSSVAMSPDIRAYLHDVSIYTRNHRAVAGGVSAISTQHLHILSRVLAALHGLTFVSPSMVALAARKVYPHRVVLVRPEQERSLQWGSSIEAVQELLRGVTVEEVIEQVLDSVETPL